MSNVINAFDKSNPRFPTPRSHDYYMLQFQAARENNHPYWIDDTIPVTGGLKNFFLELRHKLPGLISVFSAARVIPQGGAYRGFSLAYDHAPDLIVGHITVEVDGMKQIYVVESPEIRNERYRAGHVNHNIKTSTNFKTAVKTAVGALKPITVSQLWGKHTGHLYTGKAKIKEPAQTKLRKLSDIPINELFRELLHMQRSGYTPLTGAMNNVFAMLTAEGEELYRTATYDPPSVFVWLRTHDAIYKAKDEPEVLVKTPEEFPEHIRNKLAVLTIAEAGISIKDVGYKIDDTKYWVYL